MEKIGTGPEVVSWETSFLVYKKELQEVRGSNEDRRQWTDVIGFSSLLMLGRERETSLFYRHASRLSWAGKRDGGGHGRLTTVTNQPHPKKRSQCLFKFLGMLSTVNGSRDITHILFSNPGHNPRAKSLSVVTLHKG